MRGTYQHNIDAKGRLMFPAKLRESLGENIVVAKGLDDCLFVYSLPEWEAFEDKIAALPMAQSRKMQRFFCAGACDCQPDAQGRILIPQNLRDYAGLEKDVTVIGVKGRAEIWNAQRWLSYTEGMSSQGIADDMEGMVF